MQRQSIIHRFRSHGVPKYPDPDSGNELANGLCHLLKQSSTGRVRRWG